MNHSFISKLTGAIERNYSILCLGLDPDPGRYPAHFAKIAAEPQAALFNWGQTLIEQTAGLVCCYKPNFAFYEQYGPPGLAALRQTIAAVPDDIPVLLDVKRGDIGHTAAAYARAAFEVWGADAVTLNAYLGRDSLTPFLAFPGKTLFVLCYTSNPSAREIQEFGPPGADRLYAHIARQAQGWGGPEQIAFVVGATQPHALASFRALAPDRWVLAPGVGAQGGSIKEALTAGSNRESSGLILPVSRSIIYADDPRTAASTLRDEINRARAEIKPAQPARPPVEPAVDARQTDSSRTPPTLTGEAISDLIIQLHEINAVQFGNFTLASGQQSPIYVDLRRMTGRPALLQASARAYAQILRSLSFDRLAAVPYGGLPIGTAVALTTNKPLIYPRKEAKSYGAGQAIDGVFSPGEKVVIIEDVVTTGGSVLAAVERLAAAGLIVEDVVVLLDREQGAAHNLAGQGYRLHAALQFSQVLETLRQSRRISTEAFETVSDYLKGSRP